MIFNSHASMASSEIRSGRKRACIGPKGEYDWQMPLYAAARCSTDHMAQALGRLVPCAGKVVEREPTHGPIRCLLPHHLKEVRGQ